MNKITGVIITLNEEKNIEACIQSIQPVCDEIIVVDSESTDNTKAVAEKMGAKVYVQKYLGDGFQKNHGLQFAKNDWILSIDADERLTEDGARMIQALDLNNTSYEAFALRRRNYIGSRWIKVCGWYPDYFKRLYNKNHTRFSEVKGHASVTTKNYANLKCDLIHYSYRNVGELFYKAVRFSSRGAKMLHEKGKRANSFSPAVHFCTAFLRKYVLLRGFLGGIDGLTVSLSAAVNTYMKYARLLELQKDPRVLQNEDMDSIW